MFQRLALVISFALATGTATAEPDLARLNTDAVNGHILPLVDSFQSAASALQTAAEDNCEATSPALVAAFHDAVDAWTRMSHLRFGPTEKDDRAFAIAFWPDSRGKTPKELTVLLKSDEPAFMDATSFAEVSIAARGVYALEFLLFDARVQSVGTAEASCHLIQAIARDIARNADAIATDWASYAELILSPSETGPYRNDAEAAQEFYKALSTGLQFTSDTRLGRPLGTFEKPRAARAELRRSGRSLRQVRLSLEGTRDLALILAQDAPALQAQLDALYMVAFEVADGLDDPVLAGVADPQGRLRVEILQMSVDQIRSLIGAELGPALGVAAGFNALDGD
ncbi:imelysin family protein [Shimia biformata]|uniref:imelysin family protein n=1 Tax=Shimia biformata TaxID=1294299 RepID=UPI001951DDD2|nr:imelysin family protein [Shimia biformata]